MDLCKLLDRLIDGVIFDSVDQTNELELAHFERDSEVLRLNLHLLHEHVDGVNDRDPVIPDRAIFFLLLLGIVSLVCQNLILKLLLIALLILILRILLGFLLLVSGILFLQEIVSDLRVHGGLERQRRSQQCHLGLARGCRCHTYAVAHGLVHLILVVVVVRVDEDEVAELRATLREEIQHVGIVVLREAKSVHACVHTVLGALIREELLERLLTLRELIPRVARVLPVRQEDDRNIVLQACMLLLQVLDLLLNVVDALQKVSGTCRVLLRDELLIICLRIGYLRLETGVVVDRVNRLEDGRVAIFVE